MNFKNNIERCKTAQDMGYRVQLVEGRLTDWSSAGVPWSFDEPPHHYRVHPDDEEAFEADLAAREDAARRQRTPAPTPTFAEQAQSLQDQNAALKRANEQLREHVVSMEEEMRKLRADTADNLLIQLRSKLGPRASVTVHMNPEP